jgi:hypothetical protein
VFPHCYLSEEGNRKGAKGDPKNMILYTYCKCVTNLKGTNENVAVTLTAKSV